MLQSLCNNEIDKISYIFPMNADEMKFCVVEMCTDLIRI